MSRTTTVSLKKISVEPLTSHYKIGQYDFPFTLNPTIGCFFACKYCYSPIFVAKIKEQKRKQFFENVRVKINLAEKLDRQLTKLKDIPQHLKRVQINETSDYYLPKVINALKQENRDLMIEILNVFYKHAQQGNVWMLHILTKSNLILNHIDTLEKMKGMIQVEISFSTWDESARKKIEFYTTPIPERLDIISKLSQKGIFVRVMAMPFYGTENDLIKLKKISFEKGAEAFKNKSLNYYSWDEVENLSYNELINDKISRSGSRKDFMYETLNLNSGELYRDEGKTVVKTVLMPVQKTGKKKPLNWAIKDFKPRMVETKMEQINCGYSLISKINWGYIL